MSSAESRGEPAAGAQPLDDIQLRLQRPSVEEGLALEEALLESICQGESRFGLVAWSPTDRALVMPRRHERVAGFPEARRVLSERGWPIRFRATGGTPVPQSPAVVNAYQAAVGDPQRFAAGSHVALGQALPELDVDVALPKLLHGLASLVSCCVF